MPTEPDIVDHDDPQLVLRQIWPVLAAGEAVGTHQAREEARRRVCMMLCKHSGNWCADISAEALHQLYYLVDTVQETYYTNVTVGMALMIAGDPFPEEKWDDERGGLRAKKYVWTAVVASVESMLAEWQHAAHKKLESGSCGAEPGPARIASSREQPSRVSADPPVDQAASTTTKERPSGDASSTLPIAALLEIVSKGVDNAGDRADEILDLAAGHVPFRPFSVAGASDLAAVDRLVAAARARTSQCDRERAARVVAARVVLDQAQFEEAAQLEVPTIPETYPNWVNAVAVLAADRLAIEQLPQRVRPGQLWCYMCSHICNITVVAAPVPASLYFRAVDDTFVDLFGKGVGVDTLEACVGLPKGKAASLLVTTHTMSHEWLYPVQSAPRAIVEALAPHRLSQAALSMTSAFLRPAAYLAFYARQCWGGYKLIAAPSLPPIVIPALEPINHERWAVRDLIHNHICNFAEGLAAPITYASLTLWLKILKWTLKDISTLYESVDLTLEKLFESGDKPDFKADWNGWQVYLQTVFMPVVLNRVLTQMPSVYITSADASRLCAPRIATDFKRAAAELSLCGTAQPATPHDSISNKTPAAAGAAAVASKAKGSSAAAHPTAGRKAKKPQAKEPPSTKHATVLSASEQPAVASLPEQTRPNLSALTAMSPGGPSTAAVPDPAQAARPAGSKPAVSTATNPAGPSSAAAPDLAQAARPAGPRSKASTKKAAAKPPQHGMPAHPGLAPLTQAAQHSTPPWEVVAAAEVAQAAALAEGLRRGHGSARGGRGAATHGTLPRDAPATGPRDAAPRTRSQAVAPVTPRDTAEPGMPGVAAAARIANGAATPGAASDAAAAGMPGGSIAVEMPSGHAAASGIRSDAAGSPMPWSTSAAQLRPGRLGISPPADDPDSAEMAAAAPLDVTDLIQLLTAQQPLTPHAHVQHHQLSPERATDGGAGGGSEGRQLLLPSVMVFQAEAAVHQAAAPPVQAPTEDAQEVPDDFLCPITLAIMKEPVVAMDGHSYERAAIEAWFKKRVTSPKTGAPLPNTMLLPNHTLRSTMLEWKARAGC